MRLIANLATYVCAFLCAATLSAATPPDQPYELRFDKTGGVLLPLDPKLDLGSTYTIMLWVYPERYPAGELDQVLVAKALTTGVNPFYAFRLSIGPQGYVTYQQSNGARGSLDLASIAPALPLNEWSHVTVTSDGHTVYLYLGDIGRMSFPSPGKIPVNDKPISIGADYTSTGFGNSNFAGIIRQVSIWNVALSEQEVMAAMTTTFDGHEPGLVGLWPLDEGHGTTFRSIGPNRLDGSYFHKLTTPDVTAQAKAVQPNLLWLSTDRMANRPLDWRSQTQSPRQLHQVTGACAIDFNLDGHPDILTTGVYYNTDTTDPVVRAYKNGGREEGFIEVTNDVFGGAPVPLRNGSCSVADINGDGLPDVVAVDAGDPSGGPQRGVGRVVVLIQTPDGHLRDESNDRVGLAAQNGSLAGVADINGDGAPEILFNDSNGFSNGRSFFRLLMNDGAGHFSLDNSRLPDAIKGTRGPAAFLDANGDGFPDLFASRSPGNPFEIYINDGTGRFNASVAGAMPDRGGTRNCTVTAAVPADLNGDGALDLVLPMMCSSFTEGAIQILIGRGDGTFTDGTRQWMPSSLIAADTDYADGFNWPSVVRVADLNGDGMPDLLASTAGVNRVYVNNGARFIEAPEYLQNNNFAAPVVTADLDGDGRTDVVMFESAAVLGNAGFDTFWFGLNIRDVPAPASPPVSDPPAPAVIRADVQNDASRAMEPTPAGTRLRIYGTNLGPADTAVFNESSGSLPPTELGGVQVSFSTNPSGATVLGRILQASATEILVLVPYALDGSWISKVQVSYQGNVSDPVPVPIFPINPRIYATFADNSVLLADVWKIAPDGSRVKVSAAGDMNWGDRIAFRVTGAGPGQPALTDDASPAGQPFTPAYPINIFLGNLGSTTSVSPVSMTYGPDGLNGVVEITVDLPATQPAGVGNTFFITAARYTSPVVTLPFGGTPGVIQNGCTLAVNPAMLAAPAAASAQIVKVNASVGCSWAATSAADWLSITSGSGGTGAGTVSISVAENQTSAPRAGSLTVAGQTVTVYQAEAGPTVGASGTQPPSGQKLFVRFDGFSAVSLPLKPSLDLGSQYSFEFWLYRERATQSQTLLQKNIDDGTHDPYSAFSLGLDNSSVLWFGQSTGAAGSGRGPGSGSVVVPLQRWTHIAVTSDGSTITMYINGQAVGRAPSPGPIPVNRFPISLGGIATDQGYACCSVAGLFAQFAVWNRALSADEVATTMRVQLSGSEAGLAGYWPLDDGQGYLLRDRGANHLDAALVYPAPKSALNGTTTRAAQYQPQWLQRSVWESNPFDWTAQPQTTKQVTEVQRLIPIDFDSDGDMDLVSAGYYYPGRSEPSLKAYRNDGKGNFTESTADVFGSTPILVRTAARSIVTDLNHDGKPDLILGDYGSDYGGPDGGKGQNRIFIEAANGQLRDETVSRLPQTQQYVHDLDGADVNGDGQIDLVYPDTTALPFQLTLAMNDGSGKFARDNTRLPQSAAGRFPTVVRFLDANGDGKPDLFLGVGESAGDPTDILLLNNGSGTFLSMAAGALPKRKGGPACRTVNAGVADLNNDGLPDLLLTIFCDGYSEGGFQVLLNQGKGVYADATAQWLPDSLVRAGSLYATDFPWMRNVLFADFNGDGKIDVVIESLVSRPRMYMNNGRRLVETPEFLPNREMQQPGNGGVAVADFNGDGLPDIVIADQSQANTFDTLYVGLHRRPYTLPDSPVADPAAPLVVRLDVLNEASASADMPAPGTRLLINGTNVGPQSAVTFDGITARVSSNSSGDLVAIVPFALDGRWVTSMQVRNGDQVSDSVPVPLAPANPRIYTKQFADGSTVVDVWRIANGARTKITAAGQLHWGDRIAFRMTGAGQGSTAISDDSSAMEQTFVPATPFTLQIGSTTGTPYQVNPVSMRYAPDGLSGVVEVVIDLPASRPPGATNEFGLVNVRFRSLVGVNLPF